MKSKFTALIAATFLATGVHAAASPTDSTAVIEQPIVKLLSAKIENAIAELPETRSQESIQNAVYFVLAKQDSPYEVQVAAVDTVILQARALGDQQVAEALSSIDLTANEAVTASATTDAKSVRDPEPAFSFRAPPSTVSKGGSDY